MGLYQLKVMEREAVAESLTLDRAPDVVDAIPRLLAAHPSCSSIQVAAGGMHLFSVDGAPAADRP